MGSREYTVPSIEWDTPAERMKAESVLYWRSFFVTAESKGGRTSYSITAFLVTDGDGTEKLYCFG